MRLAVWACSVGIGVLFAVYGCSSSSDGGSGTSSSNGGAGGTGVTSSSSVTGTSSSTTASSSSSGSGLVPSGYTCTGAMPSINAVAAITNANCTNGSTCHTAMQSASGMYDMLVNRIAEECTDVRMMIKPSDPEHSYVIHKLTGHNLCAGEPQMPLNGTPLSSADIQTIYDWICNGAQEQ